MTDKRWCLKHEGRTFIVHQETRQAAISLFAMEIGEVFRLITPPTLDEIAAAVYELGSNDLNDGRVLVDKNPARETRHAHVEPSVAPVPALILKETLSAVAGAVEMMTNGASKDCLISPAFADQMGIVPDESEEAALERIRRSSRFSKGSSSWPTTSAGPTERPRR
jgi:hypothetical protein